MFDRFDFVYLPSRDAAADLAYFTTKLGGEAVFAVERFGTRVAMANLTTTGPRLLLAQHLEGDQPVMIFRVDNLDGAIVELAERGADLGEHFEMPFGHGVQIRCPGPQRLAIYQRTHAERGDGLAGRRDY